VAADERYDGPFCLLSAVDNRRDTRMLSAVLEHDPTHDDLRAFRRRFTMALAARDVTRGGITTEGSALSPEPWAELVRGGPPHIWTLHVLAEVGTVVWRAGASARKRLAAQQPQWPQGRPRTQAAQAAARTKKRVATRRAALCTHRDLGVQRHLSTTARKSWWRLTRGLPQVRTLRALMDQVSALFARRCRPQAALDQWAKVRRRLVRFPQGGETLTQRLSPTWEKALTVLDDQLLPATSHAVERGNRRDRKRQKQVYRVRTYAQSSARLALDMWREAQGEGRQHTLHTLHEARAA
jgi:hypothetical protein